MTRDLAGLEIVSRSFYRLESEAQKEEMCLRSVSLKPSVLQTVRLQILSGNQCVFIGWGHTEGISPGSHLGGPWPHLSFHPRRSRSYPQL